jgi:hypothetical protein
MGVSPTEWSLRCRYVQLEHLRATVRLAEIGARAFELGAINNGEKEGKELPRTTKRANTSRSYHSIAI